MDLPSEIAHALRSNELARLGCHRSCAVSDACLGLESSILVELRLLDVTGEGYKVSKLGEDVSSRSSLVFQSSVPPVLRS